MRAATPLTKAALSVHSAQAPSKAAPKAASSAAPVQAHAYIIDVVGVFAGTCLVVLALLFVPLFALLLLICYLVCLLRSCRWIAVVLWVGWS